MNESDSDLEGPTSDICNCSSHLAALACVSMVPLPSWSKVLKALGVEDVEPDSVPLVKSCLRPGKMH